MEQIEKTANALDGELILRLRKMEREEVLQFISDRLRGICDSLLELAAAVLVADQNGIDLTEKLHPSMARLLRGIARGDVDLQLVLKYQFSPHRKLLASLATLPLSDQERVARGEKFAIASASDEPLMLPVEKMTRDQFQAVFGGGAVRDPEAQRAYLESRLLNEQIIEHKPKFTIDKVNQGVAWNRPCFATKRELEQLLAQLVS